MLLFSEWINNVLRENHVFCTSEKYQHFMVVIGTRRRSAPTMKNEFISGGSILNHRLAVAQRREAWASRGHLSPERQISGCRRAGSFRKASSTKKKKKKPRPPLSNKLIKSHPNLHAKNLTRLFGLWTIF